MRHYRVSFAERALVLAILAMLSMATAVTAASPLLIHMGRDEGLKWAWQPATPLRGALYRLVLSEKEATDIAKLLPAPLQQEAFQGIDFKRQAAIIAYLGEAPSSGFAVDIHSLQIGNGQLIVNVSRRSPGQEEVTAGAITYPIDVQVVPRADLPEGPFAVEFIDQSGRTIAQRSVGAAVKPTKTIMLGDQRSRQWQWDFRRPLQGTVFEVVTSRAAARKMTDKLPLPLRKGAFGNINFKKQVAVLAYLGEAPNSGFAVDIHSVEVREKEIVVRVSRRSPAAKEITLQTISYPMVIKPLSRQELPKQPFKVRFVDQKGQLLAEHSVGARNPQRVLYHTVQPGETLWQIAWLHRVSVSDLMDWNQLTAKDTLKVGQQLKVLMP